MDPLSERISPRSWATSHPGFATASAANCPLCVARACIPPGLVLQPTSWVLALPPLRRIGPVLLRQPNGQTQGLVTVTDLAVELSSPDGVENLPDGRPSWNRQPEQVATG